MAANDRGAGPLVGQIVQYNNAGTIVPAIIWAVNPATGVVSISFNANGSSWTNVASAPFNPALAASSWAYPQFF
jgi:hypothetical protein